MKNNTIVFARPYLGKDEEHAALRVLRSGWLTTGQEALAFEQEFAEFLDRGNKASLSGASLAHGNTIQAQSSVLHALAVNSATSGLHLALQALGVGAGDIVLVPSYTFTASAETALYLGAEVVFVDTAPNSFLLDVEKLKETIERLKAGQSPYQSGGPKGRLAAIISVHFGGLPCDMKAIMELAREQGIPVVEDAAHAFPSRLENGKYAGDLGDIGVFSFYATKTLCTGEGGMLVTRDAALAKKIEIMRLHGIDRPVWNRYTGEKASWYYEVSAPGYKYNFPDLLAAIGRVQLKRAEKLLAMRQEIAACYDRAFCDDERFIIAPTGGANAYHLYPLRLNRQKCLISRNDLITRLQKEGIGVSVHFIPLHTMPFYKNRYNLKDEDFPETMKCFSDEISLPIWPGMSAKQVRRVIKTLRNVCR
ncbi:MAG: DegT/DnrJ/EryC1/StrS family aminotransferase [Spirochaetaceae bacterium]|jgi:dTDP-4-amino-4,6-dideoxygalactose transaminase|nr:DegT/DnrJ/EryC1/StrS family aminotransferase [Spirochaetaceae bacterium]